MKSTLKKARANDSAGDAAAAFLGYKTPTLIPHANPDTHSFIPEKQFSSRIDFRIYENFASVLEFERSLKTLSRYTASFRAAHKFPTQLFLSAPLLNKDDA